MHTDNNATLDEIKEAMDEFIADADKAMEKGMKAAAKRSRVTAGRITKLFKTWRAGTINSEKE